MKTVSWRFSTWVSTTLVTALAGLYLAILGCGADGDSFYMGALGLNEGRILVINSNTVAPTAQTVTMYDLDGNFISVVNDQTTSGAILRGGAMFDPYNVLLSVDTPDELWLLNIFDGSVQTWASNALLTGTIYDVVKQNDSTYLVAETSTIEKFTDGARVPPSGNPYINTTLGACVISTARGMAINSAGELLVVSNVNNRILRYGISTSTATCLTSNASFGANLPIPIVAHSNGNLYFGTQTNDAIYVGPDDLSSNPSILISANANINNPTAMAVMPDGNILVANDGTDTIVLLSTSGTVLNANFIRNAFTGTPSALLVIPPQ